jgi:hypothetical protein
MTTQIAPESENAIMNYRPAQSAGLARALVGLTQSIEEAARFNVDAAIAGDDSYTQTEVQAMVLVEQLRQVNGLDLTAVLLRAKYVQEIRQTNALANHPGGYTTMDQMARDQGISPTELSQCLDLAETIFPFVEQRLGMSVAQLWEEIGKSNFKELIPVMKQIITGEESTTASVRASADRVLEDIAATALAAGQEVDDDELQNRAIEQLLENGAMLTNRELRQHIRPERTPSIDMSVIGSGENGSRFVVCQVSEEQFTLLERRLGGYMDAHAINLPQDPHARQAEAARIPELRALMRWMEGS